MQPAAPPSQYLFNPGQQLWPLDAFIQRVYDDVRVLEVFDDVPEGKLQGRQSRLFMAAAIHFHQRRRDAISLVRQLSDDRTKHFVMQRLFRFTISAVEEKVRAGNSRFQQAIPTNAFDDG